MSTVTIGRRGQPRGRDYSLFHLTLLLTPRCVFNEARYFLRYRLWRCTKIYRCTEQYISENGWGYIPTLQSNDEVDIVAQILFPYRNTLVNYILVRSLVFTPSIPPFLSLSLSLSLSISLSPLSLFPHSFTLPKGYCCPKVTVIPGWRYIININNNNILYTSVFEHHVRVWGRVWTRTGPGVGSGAQVWLSPVWTPSGFSCAFVKRRKIESSYLVTFSKHSLRTFWRKNLPGQVRSGHRRRFVDPTSEKFAVTPELEFFT